MSRLILVLLICLAPFLAAAQETSGLARYEYGIVEDQRFGRTHIVARFSQGVPWRVFTLAEPWRVVLDFREVDWTGIDPVAFNQSDRITGLRVGAFRPGWSRMILGLSEPMEVEEAALGVDIESGRANLSVTLQRTSAEAFRETAGAPSSTVWDITPTGPVQRVTAPKDGPLRIVLDPGHGGIDPGAQKNGVREADLMLRFAFELEEVLQRAGYEVVLTRTDDLFVSLEARVAIIKQARGDLFISLHADALSDGVASGAAVYTLAEDASDAASTALAERHDRDDLLADIDLTGTDDRVAEVLMQLARLDNTPRSQALAVHVVDGIRSALGNVHKRPLQQAGFSVLKAADVPSILIELGFLSTTADLDRLQDSAWRAGMAAGIRDGIAKWAIEDEALRPLRRQ